MTFVVIVCYAETASVVWLGRFECGRSWVQALVGQTKGYKIGVCCFSAKHSALRK